MATELVEIQPSEVKFTFEVKKQSSCLIQLTNKSDHHVAFKIKTTSPKKYCVRPNTGLIEPRATCDFTVTMQAPRVAPPDLECKDKFLIQTTVAPFGTTEDDITSKMFVKDIDKYIEERKLKVVLLSPPHSPILLPHNGESKPELGHEALLQEKELGHEASLQEKVLSGVENVHPPQRIEIPENVDGVIDDNLNITKDVEGLQTAKEVDESVAANHIAPRPVEGVEEKIDTETPKFSDDYEKLTSKLKDVDLKLREAEHTIMKLMEERGAATREKDTLKQELAMVNKMRRTKTVHVGFPFLYVCLVALISLGVGYFSH